MQGTERAMGSKGRRSKGIGETDTRKDKKLSQADFETQFQGTKLQHIRTHEKKIKIWKELLPNISRHNYLSFNL